MKFRYYLHITSAVFFFVGAFFDLLVWYYGRTLELYGQDEPKSIALEKETGESPESQPLKNRTKE